MSPARLGVIAPLRHRDFRLLALGSLVSLLGDGVFRVTIAIQVFAVSDQPLALSLVASAWAVSQFVMLPVGGWAADRYDRRTVMVVADAARGVALGILAALSISGTLELWHLCLLGAVVGSANGFFNPTAMSLVPDVLPPADLERGNAFLGVARPSMLWIVGPLLGSAVIAAGGPGAALALDAATFAISGAVLLGIRRRARAAPDPTAGGWRQTRDQIVEGVRYVRRRPWAWALITAGAVSTLVHSGGFEILLPTILVFELGLDDGQVAGALAGAFAAGGAGSVLVSTVLGQRGLPRRFVTVLFSLQALALLATAGYGVVTGAWQVAAFGFVIFSSFAVVEIISATMLQRLVPRRLLGRVSSIDWMAAVGLAPLGYLLAGQLTAVFAPRVALVVLALTGVFVVAVLAFVPGVRATERLGALRDRLSDDDDLAAPQAQVPAPGPGTPATARPLEPQLPDPDPSLGRPSR
jgi:MFS family permease